MRKIRKYFANGGLKDIIQLGVQCEKGTLSVNDIPSGWSNNTSTRKALKLTKSGTSTERLQGTVWLEINP